MLAPSGVSMIGIALVLRDLVQRRLGRVVASTTTFFLSELADLAVFTALQKRGLVLLALPFVHWIRKREGVGAVAN